jgi:capsular exopolysaccharide synthesis family protein
LCEPPFTVKHFPARRRSDVRIITLAFPTNTNGASGTDWLQPPVEQQGLSSYVRTLRERIWVIVAMVALTTGAAIAYVSTASKVYEATADMIIFPAAPADQNLFNLPLIRQSSDPTRDVETAAKLITNTDVAERVQRDLDTNLSTDALLGAVSAEPVAQSNIVQVTAEAPSPEEAQAIANGFAEAAVDEQTQTLHDYIDEALPGLEAQLEDNPDAEVEAAVAQLRVLRESDNPTLQVQTPASLPTAPVSPRTKLSIVVGVIAGLILGIAAAFALQILDPRLRREEQLRRLYRLPILARVPREAGRQDPSPLNPLGLSPAAGEAYRSLRGTLAVAHRGSQRGATAILVTGSSPSEGKTTTAINLATSFAAAGNRVILIEADLRRPSISRTLGVTAKHGVVSALLESTRIEDALVTSDAFGPNLGMLLADHEGGWITELFALPSARQLIDDARALADYVIIDSPPLTDVIDALPLASYVDEVLLVVRISRTRLTKLQQLGELLAENGIKPAGFAVVGTPRPTRSDYHYYANEGRRTRARIGSGAKRE